MLVMRISQQVSNKGCFWCEARYMTGTSSVCGPHMSPPIFRKQEGFNEESLQDFETINEVAMLEQGIMIDIETLGTKAGCVVLSIGACEFSDKGVGKEFYGCISPESCTNWGLTIEPRTVLWWMNQSQDARDFITKGKQEELDTVLDALRAAFKWKGKNVWCNGASFDFPILTAAHDAVGRAVPWEYWACHDYRTIKNIVGRDVYEACKAEPTVAHNALADAVAQAHTLIRMAQHINVIQPVKEKKRAG